MPIESAYHGGHFVKKRFFFAATRWIRLRPSLRWRFRPVVIIAMCDEVAEQYVPLFRILPVELPGPAGDKSG